MIENNALPLTLKSCVCKRRLPVYDRVYERELPGQVAARVSPVSFTSMINIIAWLAATRYFYSTKFCQYANNKICL